MRRRGLRVGVRSSRILAAIRGLERRSRSFSSTEAIEPRGRSTSVGDETVKRYIGVLICALSLAAACDARPCDPLPAQTMRASEHRLVPAAPLSTHAYRELGARGIDLAHRGDPGDVAQVLLSHEFASRPEFIRLTLGSLSFARAFQTAAGEEVDVERGAAFAATEHFNALLRERMQGDAVFEDVYDGLGSEFPADLAPPDHLSPEEFL